MKIVFFLIVLFFSVLLFSEEGEIIWEQLPEIQLDSLTFGTDYTLEIMTWNLQNFPKNENTVLYAADIINAVDPDVIGFQEIQSDSAFIVLIEKLNEIDPIKKWVGFRANTDSWEMNLAYIYKTGVIENTEIYEIYDSEEDHYAFPRHPLVMEFIYQENPIVIINNHLKAKIGKENEDRRRAACEKLDKFIVENFHSNNVLIIGDLNDLLIDPDEENVYLNFLKNPENYRFADYSIAADSTADWSYPYWKYRGHLDHIIISNELFDEFENINSDIKTIVIDRYMQGGSESRYQYITDHRPVAVKLSFNR